MGQQTLAKTSPSVTLWTFYLPDTLPSISNTDLCLIHIIWANRHSLKPVPLLPFGPFTDLWKLYSSVEAVLSRGGCTSLWRWYFPVVPALFGGIYTFMWSRHLPLWRWHLLKNSTYVVKERLQVSTRKTKLANKGSLRTDPWLTG